MLAHHTMSTPRSTGSNSLSAARLTAEEYCMACAARVLECWAQRSGWYWRSKLFWVACSAASSSSKATGLEVTWDYKVLKLQLHCRWTYRARRAKGLAAGTGTSSGASIWRFRSLSIDMGRVPSGLVNARRPRRTRVPLAILEAAMMVPQGQDSVL